MTRSARERKPWIAAVLSFVLPGLGHLYGGEPRTAGLVFLLFVCGLVLSGRTTIWPAGLIAQLAFSLTFRAGSAWAGWRSASRDREPAAARHDGWYVYAVLLLALVPLTGALRVWLAPIELRYIPTPAMEPTLQKGDRVAVRKIRGSEEPVAVGEVIAFRSPEAPEIIMVKRIVALPGQEIHILDKRVFIDGEPLEESPAIFTDPRVLVGPRDNFGPLEVPSHQVFVLGDSRDRSNDSRFFGPVPVDSITGEVLYIYDSEDLTRVGLEVH